MAHRWTVFLPTLALACVVAACGGLKDEVVLTSAIQWEAPDPARGDMSRRAGTLWGLRNGTEATGFLVELVDGFRSPPRISSRGAAVHRVSCGADETCLLYVHTEGTYQFTETTRRR